MAEEIKIIEVKVKSKRKCLDQFLENDEPNTERITLEVESIDKSMVKRVDYMFHWRDWIRGIEEPIGYDNYVRINRINIGDILKIDYCDCGKEPVSLVVREGDYWWPPSSDIDYSYSISEDASPAEFKLWNKKVMRRALLKNCNDLIPDPQAEVVSIENLTQNWRIDKFVLKEYC